MSTSVRSSQVLIIGAGLAGLTAALSLPEHLQIDILSKHSVDECASAWAQGGIAAVLDSGDSIDAHVRDTLIAGAHVNDEAVVRRMLTQAPQALEWLIKNGVAFDRQNDGPSLHLTREGGHSHRRIAHVADRTGLAVHSALLRACRARTNIRIHAQHAALELLTEVDATALANKRCTGAWVRLPNGERCAWQAAHTVLATGGLGQVFASTTNPACATGDGIAMAWHGGCRVQDLEFVQFHPTALQIKGRSVGLITEALRGEGAVLRLPHTGERFMLAHDERAELAPRDVVARAIFSEMTKHHTDHVLLDITHQPQAWLQQHFPGVKQLCAQHGIDIAQQAIPVAPSAHYACGGVVTTWDGRTDMANLYAIGEVARTGLHGANRLASNSLLECVVMGRAAARHIANNALHGPSNLSDPRQSTLLANPKLNSRQYPKLGVLMNQCAGILRSQEELARAARQVDIWRQSTDLTDPLDHGFRNQLDVGALILQAALKRRTSCGAHARLDEESVASSAPAEQAA